ncbi:MAG: class I SAM-dependent methyltransferase [Bacteroidota bacterium]
MELSTAIQLIEEGVQTKGGNWADLGAGTGLFTKALLEILPHESQVHALDKIPRYLYDLWREHKKRLIVHDGDFTAPMELPPLDGILMANSLHYMLDKKSILPHLLSYLKEGGSFILVEYDTDRKNPPWVPYPISMDSWQKLSEEVGLIHTKKIASVPSQYSFRSIYSAHSLKGKD